MCPNGHVIGNDKTINATFVSFLNIPYICVSNIAKAINDANVSFVSNFLRTLNSVHLDTLRRRRSFKVCQMADFKTEA